VTIYHLLPEWEVFSSFSGGAVSKNIANIMRQDDSRVVVCQKRDDSWALDANRIIVLPALHIYSKLRARRFLPGFTRKIIFPFVYIRLISHLHEGDVVWCHNQPFVLSGLINLLHKKNVKVVYHAHTSVSWHSVYKILSKIKPDAFVFVSNKMRDEALRLIPNLQNAHVIYNGADEITFFPGKNVKFNTREPINIMCVGRLNPEKGIHVLVDAVKILNNKGYNFKVTIIGTSFAGGAKPTNYVKRLIANSPKNIEYKGFLQPNKLANEYRNADIFCCPSIYDEPFGNVNIEAMACGVPVVASRVGGIPEIASKGGVILVDPDQPEQLAKKLCFLIDSPDMRKQLALQGIDAFQKNFTWKVAVDSYNKIANSL
jgi:spore coat protein SA